MVSELSLIVPNKFVGSKEFANCTILVLIPSGCSLIQHEIRVQCAENCLPMNPLRDYGVARMISEARNALSPIVHPAARAWLPDVAEHFRLLAA
jgi:hypothetical protein